MRAVGRGGWRPRPWSGQVEPVGCGEDHGFPSELDGKPLEGFNQEVLIWFMFGKAHSGCDVEGRVEAKRLTGGFDSDLESRTTHWSRLWTRRGEIRHLPRFGPGH